MVEAIMNFDDIPRFTPRASYMVAIPLTHVERTLRSYHEENKDGLFLDPDFQRGHVWTQAKQIAYVEYLLRGGDYSRLILFNHPNWMGSFKGPMELVDGKQRLEAVRAFMNNEIQAFGTYYKDFEGSISITNTLTFGINSLKTRAEVLTWYLELNSGGVVHTEDELEKVRRMLAEEQKLSP
jgi:hypothetical protein